MRRCKRDVAPLPSVARACICRFPKQTQSTALVRGRSACSDKILYSKRLSQVSHFASMEVSEMLPTMHHLFHSSIQYIDKVSARSEF